MPAEQSATRTMNDRPGENEELVSDFDPNRVGDPDKDDPNLLVPENGAVLREQADRGPAITTIDDGDAAGVGSASGASIQAQIDRDGKPEKGIGER